MVAVYSTPIEEARSAAAEYDISDAYGSWEQMLDEVDMDLVTVALPPFLHFPVVMAALERGCSVLCEKPMALDPGEAREMLAEAEARGAVHLVDHELRFSPTYQHLKGILEAEKLGEIRHVRWHNINSFRADRDQPWSWWSDVEAGGGNLMAGASHGVDLMRWLFGPVMSVSAQLATWIPERMDTRHGKMRAVTSDDQYSLLLEMEQGTMAWLFGSSVARHQLGMKMEIVGAEGTVLLDEDDRLWMAETGRPFEEYTQPDPYADLEGVPEHIWGRSFVGLARELVSAVKDGRSPDHGATFQDGLRTQMVLAAATRSWEDRSWKEVEDPS